MGKNFAIILVLLSKQPGQNLSAAEHKKVLMEVMVLACSNHGWSSSCMEVLTKFFGHVVWSTSTDECLVSVPG